MSRIYITGDTHMRFVQRLSNKNFAEAKTLTEDDYIIITGDFGGLWDDSKQEKYNLNWLNHRPATVLFIEGNHENYNLLKKYPIEEWKGGKVQFIRENVIHLMRGQVYEIAGKKFFTMGGASCHDVEDGILDPADPDFIRKKRLLDMKGRKYYRTKGVNWWQEELPSKEEMQEGLYNLQKYGNKVDCIITHCIYDSLQAKIDAGRGEYKSDILTQYFQKIKETVTYEHWYFGHYHREREFAEESATCMFEGIKRIV